MGWSNEMGNGQFTESIIYCWVTNHTKTVWFQTTIISFARESRGQQLELGSAGQFFSGVIHATVVSQQLDWDTSFVCLRMGGG